jgi:hypothetical protein
LEALAGAQGIQLITITGQKEMLAAPGSQLSEHGADAKAE